MNKDFRRPPWLLFICWQFAVSFTPKDSLFAHDHVTNKSKSACNTDSLKLLTDTKS